MDTGGTLPLDRGVVRKACSSRQLVAHSAPQWLFATRGPVDHPQSDPARQARFKQVLAEALKAAKVDHPGKRIALRF
nr:hypothetical protein [Aurantimonas coralicida]